MKHRNVLMLMADELRYDCAGFMGNTVVRTPVLDGLAGKAVIFDNAFTPSPVCIPARQCLAMGKYPVHCGCEEFGEDLAPGSLTFARHFANNGYYTVACGKLHHRGPDQMQGWLQRIGAETAVDWPSASKEISQIGRRKWRGLDDLRESGIGESPLAIHDEYTVRGACDFIRIHFGGMYPIPAETPLFLLVSLQQPHFPLLTSERLFHHYLDKVPLPKNQTPAAHPVLGKGAVVADGETVRRATTAYYGMIEQTDQRIGAVLSALTEAGQDLDEWIILFCVDHGEMLGEHGVWGKRKFYEGSVRVPMFLHAPSLPPSRRTDNTNLVDLFPTLCALTGLKTPSGLDGRNIVTPALEDETFSQFSRNHWMVKKGSWKYMTFGEDGPDVLFHLGNDPGETLNLAEDADCLEVVRELHEKLHRLQQQTCPAVESAQ